MDQSVTTTTNNNAVATAAAAAEDLIKIAFVNTPDNLELNMTTCDLTESLELEDVWANKSEISNWKGPIPISEYPINVDSNPIVIKKEFKKKFETKRKVLLKYLEPTTQLKHPGDIVVNQDTNIRPQEAPPLILYQMPELPATPQPLIIREKPPTPPPVPAPKIITIPGKLLPSPPRTILIEKQIHPSPCLYCDILPNLKFNQLRRISNYNTSMLNDFSSKFFSKASNSKFSIGRFSAFNNSNNTSINIMQSPFKNSLRSSVLGTTYF